MKKVARLRVPQDEFLPPPGGKLSIESVNVRTTGRIKKPKAVYDPSDNYVPRAQRLTQVTSQPQHLASPKSINTINTVASPTTPTTKIGRERSLSTGSNTSININSQDYDTCGVCEKREPRRGGNYRNKLFPCIDCNKKIHKKCASIDFYEGAPIRQSYKCENCRICEICNEPGSKTNVDIIMCAKCCKTFHPNCHTPKITKLQQSQRNWKCSKCTPIISNAFVNSSSSSSSHAKDESMPVTVIRQIIGDDINLQALPKTQSHLQVSIQQKLEQPIKRIQMKQSQEQQAKSQEHVNIEEASVEVSINSKAANKRKSVSENLSSSSPSSSSIDDSEDEDYNYVEKKKRKILHKNPSQETNNNNNNTKNDDSNGDIEVKVDENVNGNGNGFNDIHLQVKDSDTDISENTIVTNATSHTIYDIPKREVIRSWSVDRVAAYIGKYFPNEAYVFKDQEIDGNALLLLTRSDVVQKLPLKLGQSLRLFNLILKIQTQKLNDPTLGWDCSADTLFPSTE